MSAADKVLVQGAEMLRASTPDVPAPRNEAAWRKIDSGDRATWLSHGPRVRPAFKRCLLGNSNPHGESTLTKKYRAEQYREHEPASNYHVIQRG